MSDYIGNNLYALMADTLVFLHLCYLVFTVGGELAVIAGWIRGWGWIRNRVFRFLHLASVLLVALEALLGIWCPLTVWEYRLRHAAGQVVEEDISFVGRLLRMILFYEFPPVFFTVLYVGFGGLVLLTFIHVPPRKKEQDK